MEFSRSVIPIGKGFVCSARHEDGDLAILCKVDGAIVRRTVVKGKRSVSDNRIVSYADEGFLLGGGMIEKKGGNLNYVAKV